MTVADTISCDAPRCVGCFDAFSVTIRVDGAAGTGTVLTGQPAT
jgi:hypothetical protein